MAFQFPQCLVKSVLGPAAWRFQSDPGGIKYLILGPGIQNCQHTNWSDMCWVFSNDLTIILGSTQDVVAQERGGSQNSKEAVNCVHQVSEQTV